MILANVERRLTTFVGGEAVDVEEKSGGLFDADPALIYPRWGEFREWADGIGAKGAGDVAPSRLDAPSPRPPQVFGLVLNYRDHAAEAGLALPAFPAAFTKFPSCIVGPRTPVELAGATSDWEVELVVVMGRRATNTPAVNAWDHVAGLTIGQDLSERALQLAGPLPQFSLGKSFSAYGPIGPWLVTPDELTDPDDLAIRCSLDGETVQESRTSQLIFSVADLIAQLSTVLTLLPGDLIFTGTPAGVGWAREPQRFLTPGQQLISEIEGIGRLTTSFVASGAASAVSTA
ncbi:Ureidoglycolate lyase [Mycolicibacterium vanbaalenii]|uniref:Ureidoglycolate lyase n=1 Tax=Mycolicibacterium vanbaalenii TaxID=110539 RepID=A0A5S9QZ48_MYCVN|nr:fumarylacetoacetate hydrolase family protein [Mycolicibacterium vanbaalenii]CAA0124849.1 Ureidoglycolate lyase [Mycolicibacterium vanbaalenii]